MISRQFLGVLACVTTVAACGGSSGGPAAKSGGSPTAASTALTSAHAQQLAAAAVLKPSDLPGFAAKAQSHTASDVATENTGRGCLGLSVPPNYLARNFGTAFTKGNLEVDSSADVAVSTAQARQELQALTSARAPRCAKAAILPALTAEGLTVKTFSAVVVSASVSGADGTFGYKYVIDATAQGQAVHIRGYEVGALADQVEIDVTVIGAPPLAVSFAQAEQLAATSVSRVKAAAQG